MKRLILALLVIPTLSIAQQPGGMDPAKMMQGLNDPALMQKMMQQAQAVQVCMEKIDRAKLDAIKTKGEAASQEIDRLCRAGKKDEALAKGMEMGRSMMSDPTVKQLRECTKGMEDIMKGMPGFQMPNFDDFDEESARRNICS